MGVARSPPRVVTAPFQSCHAEVRAKPLRGHERARALSVSTTAGGLHRIPTPAGAALFHAARSARTESKSNSFNAWLVRSNCCSALSCGSAPRAAVRPFPWLCLPRSVWPLPLLTGKLLFRVAMCV